MYALGSIGLINHSVNPQLGIFSFKDADIPPTVMADELNALGFATRSGLHCAPLAHESAGTIEGGTVRFSFSPFNNAREVERAAAALAGILKMSPQGR